MSEPQTPGEALLLDEMYPPTLAALLREEGFDVLAVAGHPTLEAATDDELFGWAQQQGRRLVTENVKDFQILLVAAREAGASPPRLLYTSARSLARSRHNLGPILKALRRWLCDPAGHELPEAWLSP